MTKIEKLCIKWLNDNYNHMEPFLMKEYPDYIFHMKDGKCILQHNKKNGYVYVSYSEIWKFFELYFSMSNQQIKDITKIWVEDYYEVGVTATNHSFGKGSKWVEEHYKVGITTTIDKRVGFSTLVEEQYKVGVKSTQEFGWRLQKEVDEQYKEEITTSGRSMSLPFYKVDEQYKIDVTSTMVDYREITIQTEEQYKLQTNIK